MLPRCSPTPQRLNLMCLMPRLRRSVSVWTVQISRSLSCGSSGCGRKVRQHTPGGYVHQRTQLLGGVRSSEAQPLPRACAISSKTAPQTALQTAVSTNRHLVFPCGCRLDFIAPPLSNSSAVPATSFVWFKSMVIIGATGIGEPGGAGCLLNGEACACTFMSNDMTRTPLLTPMLCVPRSAGYQIAATTLVPNPQWHATRPAAFPGRQSILPQPERVCRASSPGFPSYCWPQDNDSTYRAEDVIRRGLDVTNSGLPQISNYILLVQNCTAVVNNPVELACISRQGAWWGSPGIIGQ